MGNTDPISRVGLMVINPSWYCAKQKANNGRKHKKHAIMKGFYSATRRTYMSYALSSQKIDLKKSAIKDLSE